MIKNKSSPLNHSLACASYAIYLAIHTWICKESKKWKSDEKGGQQVEKARYIIEN